MLKLIIKSNVRVSSNASGTSHLTYPATPYNVDFDNGDLLPICDDMLISISFF